MQVAINKKNTPLQVSSYFHKIIRKRIRKWGHLILLLKETPYQHHELIIGYSYAILAYLQSKVCSYVAEVERNVIWQRSPERFVLDEVSRLSKHQLRNIIHLIPYILSMHINYKCTKEKRMNWEMNQFCVLGCPLIIISLKHTWGCVRL